MAVSSDPATPTTSNGQHRSPSYIFNKLYIYGLPICAHESKEYWEQRAELKRRFPSRTKLYLESSFGRAVLSYSSEDDRNYDAMKNIRDDDVKYNVKTQLKTIKTVVVHGHVDILSVKAVLKLSDQPWVTLALRAAEVSIYFNEGTRREYERVSKLRKIMVDDVSYRVSVVEEESNAVPEAVSPATTPAPWASASSSPIISKIKEETAAERVNPIIPVEATSIVPIAEAIAPAAEDYRMPPPGLTSSQHPPPGIVASSQHVETTSVSTSTTTTVVSAAASDVSSSTTTIELKDAAAHALKLKDEEIAQLKLKAINALIVKDEEIARLKLKLKSEERENRGKKEELKLKDDEIARLIKMLDERGSELVSARKEMQAAAEQLRAATNAVDAERAAKHKFEGETGVYKSMIKELRVEADAASNEARQLRTKYHKQTNILVTRSMLENLEILRLEKCSEKATSANGNSRGSGADKSVAANSSNRRDRDTDKAAGANGTIRCTCNNCNDLFERMLAAIKERFSVVDKFDSLTLRQQISWSYSNFSEVAHPLTRETIDVNAFESQRRLAIYGAATVLDWPHET
ncbi:hypothetical protein HDU89_001372 [Geranomyces variabilis]|nr:hypothetical protein HDU89_001372 [Geranomyces variabilis]